MDTDIWSERKAVPQLGKRVLVVGGGIEEGYERGLNDNCSVLFLLLILVILFKLFKCPKRLTKKKTKSLGCELKEQTPCPWRRGVWGTDLGSSQASQ